MSNSVAEPDGSTLLKPELPNEYDMIQFQPPTILKNYLLPVVESISKKLQILTTFTSYGMCKFVCMMSRFWVKVLRSIGSWFKAPVILIDTTRNKYSTTTFSKEPGHEISTNSFA
jgi:hypothetical protein